jgi:hypothetical protein
MELLLFCRPAALAWAAPYRFCCGAAFALSYADKRGDRTVSDSFLAIPHKERLATLHAICLQIFRHISQKFDDVSVAQSLCGIAFYI